MVTVVTCGPRRPDSLRFYSCPCFPEEGQRGQCSLLPGHGISVSQAGARGHLRTPDLWPLTPRPLGLCASPPVAGHFLSYENRTRHRRERENTEKLPKPRILAPRPPPRTRSGRAGASPHRWRLACWSERANPSLLTRGFVTLSLNRVPTRLSSRVDCFLGPNSWCFHHLPGGAALGWAVAVTSPEGQVLDRCRRWPLRRAAGPHAWPRGIEGLRSARRADPAFHPGWFRRPRGGCHFTLRLLATLICPPPGNFRLCVLLLVPPPVSSRAYFSSGVFVSFLLAWNGGSLVWRRCGWRSLGRRGHRVTFCSLQSPPGWCRLPRWP